MEQSFIPIELLGEEPYSAILGYPRATAGQLSSRMRELDGLGVSSVSFTGDLQLGKLCVLGKGYVGLVVLARLRSGRRTALKIRRLDSQRDSLRGEARLLETANRAGVGPALYSGSMNFLVMELLDGEPIGRWMRDLTGRGSVAALKGAILQIMEDCFRLDRAGLDHGELSSITKHAVVAGSKTTLIDFDSASMSRRVSNVTSACQGIFIGSAIARRTRRMYRVPTQEEIIGALRVYKSDPTRKSFELLLSTLKLH